MRIIRFVGGDDRVHIGERRSAAEATLLSGSIETEFRRTNSVVSIQRLLPPVEPPEIICLGRNYFTASQGEDERRAARQRLSDADLEVFLKPRSALTAADATVTPPRFDDGADADIEVEGELVIVIGRTAHRVSVELAPRHIFGYALACDVTARRFQTPAGPPLWMRGKGFDGFCPLGPELVSIDELAHIEQHRVVTRINGEAVRDGSFADMIRSPAMTVATLSRHLTLLPGTVILTSGPPAIKTLAPLRPSDAVELEIPGVQRMRVKIAAQK